MAYTTTATKVDEPPLLSSGAKTIGFWQLDEYFYKPFVTWSEDASRRKHLITNLSRYISELRKFGIPFEIWVDGSFTTAKVEPDDIDLTVFVYSDDLVRLPADSQPLFERLTIEREIIKALYDIDVYLALLDNPGEVARWTKTYSRGHNSTAKGFFKISFLNV